jgi:hypothetical protein
MFIILSNKRVNVNSIISYNDTTKTSVGDKPKYGITFHFQNQNQNTSSYGSEPRETLWYDTKEERDSNLAILDKLLDLQKFWK